MAGPPRTATLAAPRPAVAFGPALPGWGSWDWVGADLIEALTPHFDTRAFAAGDLPDADLVVVVKHLPPAGWVEEAARRAPVVYCPVDAYGAAAEIDADGPLLRRCARVAVHCRRLERYFAPYAPTAYVDHHVKFATAAPLPRRGEGPVLWVGVRTNLPPLVEWVNRHPPPGELWILSNFEGPPPGPAGLGLRTGLAARVGGWTPARQAEWSAAARAALDVKGQDFRARHKPPAKAIDFIASGLPLALDPDSSPAEHLAGLGFEVACPLDHGRWLSQGYWEETRRFGGALRELLSRDRVATRFRRLLDDVLRERRAAARG